MAETVARPTRAIPTGPATGRATVWFTLLLLLWFATSLAVLAIFARGLVEYAALFCGGFGGVLSALRDRVRPAFVAVHLDNLLGFCLLSVAVISLEELLVDAFVGPGGLAQPSLGLDLLWINAIWLGWLVPWYVWVAPRFSFTPLEAWLVGGSPGILFETIFSRAFLISPVVLLLWVPLGWVIYGVVFLGPLQLLTFRSVPSQRHRVLSTLAVTWGTSTVVALGLWALLSALGVQLK